MAIALKLFYNQDLKDVMIAKVFLENDSLITR